MDDKTYIKKASYIITGFIIIIAVIYLLLINWINLLPSTITFIKGGIVIIVLLIALIFILLGFTEL